MLFPVTRISRQEKSDILVIYQFRFCFLFCDGESWQRSKLPRKIKIARAVVLARKRVLCWCYKFPHERAFLHYFLLNQITKSNSCFVYATDQSVEDPINIIQYRRCIFETISGKCLSSVSSNYFKSKDQNCKVLRKLLLLLLSLSSFFLLLLFSL